MRSDLWQRRVGWAAMVTLILACGARAQIALAQSENKKMLSAPAAPVAPAPPAAAAPPAPAAPRYELLVNGEGKEGHRFLGLHVREADPALRAQLGLDQAGLIVVNVADGSPAGKAGVKQHDVLVAAGDSRMNRVKDLTKAVDAADGEISLKVIRGGKEQTIAVSPGERPQDVIRFVAPSGRGMVFSRGLGPRPMLPDDLSLTIEREGQKPAKITVQRGDDRWEIGEEELGKLPEDVRKSVAPFLAGLPMIQSFSGAVSVAEPFTFALPPPGAAGGPGPGNAFPPEALRRLDEISARVEQLSEEIRRMHRSPPGREQDDRPPPRD